MAYFTEIAMKSEYGDRETIGSQLLKTHDEHMKSDPIEAGDFVNEFGKQYMSDLFDYLEYGSKHYDKFYINILSRKTKLYQQRAIEVFPRIEPDLPLMEPNQDVWAVNCAKQSYDLLWSLPDESEFDLVLANPCKDNEKLIHWINIYKDLKRMSKKKKIIKKQT